jgi:hypothetical protein
LWIFILSISCKKDQSAEGPSQITSQTPPATDSFSIFTNQKRVGPTDNDRKGGGIGGTLLASKAVNNETDSGYLSSKYWADIIFVKSSGN